MRDFKEPKTKQEYIDILAIDQKWWGIEQQIIVAQKKRETEVIITPEIIVPLSTVTTMISRYQWSFDMDNLPNQMRRIKKITLV